MRNTSCLLYTSFPDKWVHLRKSNTEPIIRVYSEAATMEAADEIGQKIMDVVYSLAKMCIRDSKYPNLF